MDPDPTRRAYSKTTVKSVLQRRRPVAVGADGEQVTDHVPGQVQVPILCRPAQPQSGRVGLAVCIRTFTMAPYRWHVPLCWPIDMRSSDGAFHTTRWRKCNREQISRVACAQFGRFSSSNSRIRKILRILFSHARELILNCE
jgi:hypothetical protein